MLEKRQNSSAFIFCMIMLLVGLFATGVIYKGTLDTERKLPKLQSSVKNIGLRGDIVTDDNFTIATSKKLYKASVDARCIDPDKMEIFVNLYSIYTNEDPKKIRKILEKNKNSQAVLSYDVDSKSAAHLRHLAKRLYHMKLFIPRKDEKGKSIDTQGLDISESGEKRIYIKDSTLTPLIGYITKIEKDGITRTAGVKGIEKFYNEILISNQDGYTRGLRDVLSNIILTAKAKRIEKIDGDNIILTIPLKFQKIIEKIADERANFLNAKEVVIAIMNSKNGHILSLASSLRYDPSNIKKDDFKSLNPSITEFPYEVGSIIKPFFFSILLEKNRVNPLERINTHNGAYKLGKKVITDTHKADFLSAEDVITWSSNIGMIELSKRLNAFEIHDGLTKFGFGEKSNIDLPYEKVGKLSNVNKLENFVNKAVLSYGYGSTFTFAQMLSAYNAFNNKGVVIAPRLVKNYKFESESRQAISKETAKTIKRILIKVVDQGTGKKTKIEGLEIGGKTGTAHINLNNYANNRYNSSFFGFVNDKFGNSYTIGVLVKDPKKQYYHFASQSALPTFRLAVEAMLENGYLKLEN